jgi:large repetitive protein
MAIAIGKVAFIQGQAFVQMADGSRHVLKVGDPIMEDAVIVTGPNGRVELAFDNGQTFHISEQQTITLDKTVLGTELPENHDAALFGRTTETAALARSLAEGRSLDELLEETSAGMTGGGGNEDDGHSFVQLLRVVETVSPAGYESESARTYPPSELTSTTLPDMAPPSAVNDTATTRINTAITAAVLANDTDPQNDPLTVTMASVPASQGSVVINPDGTLTFTPAPGYIGDATVNYTISDGHGGSSSAVLTITVSSNGTPTFTVTDNNGATAGEISVSEAGLPTGSLHDGSNAAAGTMTVTAPNGLASIDFGGTAVTLAQLNALGTTPVTIATPDGILTLTGYNATTGVISYSYAISAPQTAPGTSVADSITVVVHDGAGISSAATSFTATIADDVPTAHNDSTSVTEDATPNTVSGNVLNNDTVGADVNTTAITPAAVTLTHGSLVLNSNGTYTYTLNNSDTAVNALNVGQKLTDSYTYTLTDKDGDTSNAILNITINGANDAPIVAAGASAYVSENLLSGAIASESTSPFTGTADIAQQKVWSGNLAITDPDSSTFTINLTAPTTSLTSGGQAVTWTGGNGGSDLVGAAGGHEVLRVHMTNAGGYTVTLSGAVDHPTGAGSNVLSLGIGVAVSDGAATTHSTLSVSIEDSVPTMGMPHQGVIVPPQNTNIEIVLDISTSMNTADAIVNGATMTRLEAAKQAIDTLLDTYSGMGNVMVRLVTFSDTAAAHGSKWETASAVKDYLNGLSVHAGTNYDAALASAQDAFAASGKIAGAQNVSYFLTDGLPNYGVGTTSTLTGANTGNGRDQSGADVGIQSAEESTWTTFLSDNHINSFAFGMGGPYTGSTAYDGLPHTSQYYLDPIAYNGATGTNTNGIVVSDWNQLTGALQSTVAIPSVNGNFLSGTLVDSGSGIGADGGYVRYVIVDSVTYTYDHATHAVTNANGTTSIWNSGTDTLTVHTSHGGTLVVDMGTATYTYTPPSTLTVAGAYTETLSVQVVDKDGDIASGSLHLDVARALGGTGNDAIVASSGENVIIGGQGSDTLTGNSESDTFRWSLGDATSSPTDIVTNFKTSAAANGGDVIDLRDMLVGESHSGTDPGNLANYLHFGYSGGNTTISVTTHDSASTTQLIALAGVNLVGNFTSDQQIIQDLLTKGKLVTD